IGLHRRRLRRLRRTRAFWASRSSGSLSLITLSGPFRPTGTAAAVPPLVAGTDANEGLRRLHFAAIGAGSAVRLAQPPSLHSEDPGWACSHARRARQALQRP